MKPLVNAKEKAKKIADADAKTKMMKHFFFLFQLLILELGHY